MDSKAKYSLYTYLFLFLSIFSVFVFTKDFYYEFVDNKSQLEVLKQSIDTKNQEYTQLSKIKSQIESGTVKDLDFNKFLTKFREDEIIDYLYSYANNHISWVKIENVSLTEWKLNEIWFNESKINLVAVFSTEQDMVDMINFLLKSEKYALYIHEFSYPYGQTQNQFRVTIPLKVLYK